MSFIHCAIDETEMGEEVNTIMKKFQKRDIKYGPAPTHLVEAIRKELLKLVKAKDLENKLGELGRAANQADDFLMCLKAPEAVMRSEHEITVPGVATGATNVETYGATIIREVMAAYQKNSSSSVSVLETPEGLVRAIAIAREQGMPDVAAELEMKLTGKKLDGKRPVKKTMKTAADYLAEADRAIDAQDLTPKPMKHLNGHLKTATTNPE